MNNFNTGCPEQADIVAFLRGELDPHEQQSLEQHFETCSSCRKLAGEFQATINELRRDSGPAESSMDLTGRILAGIPADAWKPVVSLNWLAFRPVLGAAACFAIVCGMATGLWLCNRAMMSSSQPGRLAAVKIQDKPAALKSTIQWLASVQEPSGRWDTASLGGKREYDMALNGLALLAFTRNPDTTGKNPAVIDRAVKYLVSCQNDAGFFGEASEGMMYNQGIVTLALLEAYANGRDPSLKPHLDRALAFIRKQQLGSGGWGYSNRPDITANTSVSVWQLQALLLSARLGWDDQKNSLRKGLIWLNSMIDDKGQFGYDSPKDSPEGKITLTAMGAMCMFMAPETEGPYKKEILMRLKQTLMASGKETGLRDFYRCYFRAAAFKASGTEQHDRMLADLQHSLLPLQDNSGKQAGSWSPNDRWGPVGGRIYSTSVAALTLEMNSIR